MNMESTPNFESDLPTREEVITILRDRGIDDPEAKKLLLAYDTLGRILTDATDDQETINKERFKRVIEMAGIYFEAGYREYAVESLEELSFSSQSDEMMDAIRNELEKMDDHV